MPSLALWMEQSIAATCMVLPRAFWVLAVVGVASVAGERLPDPAAAAGMASAAPMREAAEMERP